MPVRRVGHEALSLSSRKGAGMSIWGIPEMMPDEIRLQRIYESYHA